MTVYENYDNIYRFMDVIKSRPNTRQAGDSAKRDSDNSWYGMSYENALEAFAKGLPEKAALMQQEVRKIDIKSNISISKARPRNYYYGYSPNIPAAIIGLPKSMRQIQRVPQKVKAVTIFYDATMNGGTDVQTLESAGLCVLKLVYLLEKSGYRVKLDYTPFAGTKGSENAICALTLKEWKQPLDLLKLSFPLTSAAMFRRFGFLWIETVPGIHNWGSCKGSHLSKSNLVKLLRETGRNIDNIYVIDVPACKQTHYNPVELAESINIKI